MRAWRGVQTRLRRRGIYAGLGVFFSTLVFVCLPESVPWVELLRAGGPTLGFVLLAMAAFFWWRYLEEVRAMRGTGLGPTKNPWVVTAWVGSGALVAEGLAWLLTDLTGTRWAGVLVRPLGAATLFLAYRWGQLEHPVLWANTQTLFKDDDQANG
jgi:thiol:disulfide interchange protein